MTSTAPNQNIKDNFKEQISCKLVSEIIRERIKAEGADFMQAIIFLSLLNQLS